MPELFGIVELSVSMYKARSSAALKRRAKPLPNRFLGRQTAKCFKITLKWGD